MRETGNTKRKIGLLLAGIFFVFIGHSVADEIVYKYHKMLIEKVNNPDIQEIEGEKLAWEEAKKIAMKFVSSIDVEQPVTLLIKNNRYIDSSRGLRGIYDKDLNIVIATDWRVLVHEYLHAIFYLTGNREMAEDESFIRTLYPAL